MTGRARVAVIAVYFLGASILVALLPSLQVPSLAFFLALAPLFVAITFTDRLAQAFVALEPLKSGEQVYFPVEERQAELSRDSEAPDVDMGAEVSPNSGTEWKCVRCGEQNPAQFDVCWRCAR